MNILTIKAIQKEINYLEDNKFRYKLNNIAGKHDQIIKKHQNDIDILNKDLEEAE